MKTISIASDHAGFELKSALIPLLEKMGYPVSDRGCHNSDRVDYPDYAALVAKDIQTKAADCGIIVCGTGVGVAITANKFPGVRAASLTDVYSTQMAREHNDLNVLCLGARVIGLGLAELILKTFLTTAFEGGRHAERIKKIHGYEKD